MNTNSELQPSSDSSASGIPGAPGLNHTGLNDSSQARRIRQLESALTETRKQNRALEALRQMSFHLLSNALHELRTPLVPIRGYARMLLGEEPGPITPTQRQLLEIVLGNANRLAGILNDLTGLCRDRTLRAEPFDLRGLWQEVLEALRPEADRKSVRISERSSPGAILLVGDRQEMLPVFRRLLADAIEGAGQGGEIQVEFRRDDERSELWIRGAGAPLGGGDQQAALLRDIILLHGGRICRLQSPGQPCVLTLIFPVIPLEQCEENHTYE